MKMEYKEIKGTRVAAALAREYTLTVGPRVDLEPPFRDATKNSVTVEHLEVPTRSLNLTEPSRSSRARRLVGELSPRLLIGESRRLAVGPLTSSTPSP